MNYETLTYQADGLSMCSQLFFEPADGPRAGVLVFPEAFGLGGHAISRAERLAKMGYVALACDLHGEGRVIDGLEEAVGALKPLFADPSRTRARARGGLEALTVRPEVDAARVASIGFCFGGTMSLELARDGAALKAVMREAGVDWQMHLYGNTVHSFTNTEAARRDMPDAIRYSPKADARSWASLTELFSETLTG